MLSAIRWILGKIILFFDALLSPTPVERSQEEQQKIEEQLKGYSIYQFQACPFCVKVRRYMKKANIQLPLRDAKNNAIYATELKTEGGKVQVPCLRIELGESSRWLYESNDIIQHLSEITKVSP